jgi:hypothetical protein
MCSCQNYIIVGVLERGDVLLHPEIGSATLNMHALRMHTSDIV